MQGLKVGHFTDREKGTGLSVFLFDRPAVGAYLLCGSGSATHELAPLDPEGSVCNLHGLTLSGGSAFGLFTAEGVMRFLAERGMGLTLPNGVIPIVPAAAIYDLGYKKPEAPTAEDAYRACLNAYENNCDSGQMGAGTGATVGKIIPEATCMSSGIGYAEMALANGVNVVAYAVVNAVGDIRDAEGKIVAGARLANGKFADCRQFLLTGKGEEVLFFDHTNTTLVAVFTNAKFSKAELKRISKMAIAGLGQAVSPVFTCYDGDILFSISVGELAASVLTVGVLAAEVVRRAILNAVKDAQ